MYKLDADAKVIVDSYAQSNITGASQEINTIGDGRADSTVGDNLFAIDSDSVDPLKTHLTSAQGLGANCRFREFDGGLVADINGVKVVFFYNEGS